MIDPTSKLIRNISAMPTTSTSSTSKSSSSRTDSYIPNVSLSTQACRCPHLDAILPQTIDIRVLLDVHNNTQNRNQNESKKNNNDCNKNTNIKDNHYERKKEIDSVDAIQLLHLLPFLDSSPSFSNDHKSSDNVTSSFSQESGHTVETSTNSNNNGDNEASTNNKSKEKDMDIRNHKNDKKKSKCNKNNNSSNNQDDKNLKDKKNDQNKSENEDNSKQFCLALESFDHNYSHLSLRANTKDPFQRTLKNENNLNDTTGRTKKQKLNNSITFSKGMEKDYKKKDKHRNKPRFIDSDDDMEDQIPRNQSIMSDSIKNETKDRQINPSAPTSMDHDVNDLHFRYNVPTNKENKIDKSSNKTNESSEYYLTSERYEQLRQAEHEQSNTLFFESLPDEVATTLPTLEPNSQTKGICATAKRAKLKKSSSIFSLSSSSSSSINTLGNSSLNMQSIQTLSNDVVESTGSCQELKPQNANDTFKERTNENKEIGNRSKTENTYPTSIKLTNTTKKSPSTLENILSNHQSQKSHRRSKKRRHVSLNNEMKQNDLLLDIAHIAAIVDQWIDVFRKSRNFYWEQKLKTLPSPTSTCTYTPNNNLNFNQRSKKHQSSVFLTDDMMKCLECSMLGYGPCFASPPFSFQTKENLMYHFITSGHSFGVTCGHRSELFCMRCGDFVYHPILDREKLRIDLSHHLPFFSWKEDIIRRSADVFPMRSSASVSHDWPKIEATYPCAISPVFMDIAKQNFKRYQILHGNLEDSLTWGRKATRLALSQYKNQENGNFQIKAPIGIYNLGNTCYVNCVLQCLLHCVPLQHFFLNNVGHNYAACKSMRKICLIASSTNDEWDEGSKNTEPYKEKMDCLACELDKIFLETLSSSIGTNIIDALEESSSPTDLHTHQKKEKSANDLKATIDINGNGKSSTKVRNSNGNIEYSTGAKSNHSSGMPIVPFRFLTTSWKSKGMSHLAGYEQRDAHEFLHAFLDTIGKDNKMYYDLAQKMGGCTLKNQKQCVGAQYKDESDIVKKIFEGTLRSVLVCECCGCKRSQPEPFVIISLPITKAKGKVGSVPQSNKNNEKGTSPTSSRRGSSVFSKITIEKCLTQFTEPEVLTDPVFCSSCGKNTPTKKQHTFARLPQVLCLHLKRFDAKTNKKIEHTVSYPIEGLNMGMTLPHWCEISQAKSSQFEDKSKFVSSPDVLYDLFGTVNHVGNLHQGHYTANVKVKNRWYGCNDAFISEVSMEEKEAMGIDNAYILFYMRRDSL